MTDEEIYLCVGICLPSDDGAYCIGCGRPWGTKVEPTVEAPRAGPEPTNDERANPSPTAG